MNAPKHTPGPWRYLPNLTQTDTGESDGYAYPYLVYAGSEFVAQVATDQLCEESRDEENARLIAAAPDMHAAIRNFLDTWYGPDHDGPANEARELRAALAKATGDAS
jgi:hypothetical protein